MSAKSVIFFSTIFMASCASLVNAQGDTPTRAPKPPVSSTPGSSDEVLWGLNTLEVIAAFGVPSLLLLACCIYCLFRRASYETIDGLFDAAERRREGRKALDNMLKTHKELKNRLDYNSYVRTQLMSGRGEVLDEYIDEVRIERPIVRRPCLRFCCC